MVSHYGFDVHLHFLGDCWCPIYFHILFGHLYIFGEMSFWTVHYLDRAVCLFLIELCESLYFLDMNTCQRNV